MATGKVARRAAVSEIAALLDSEEIAGLIGELEALRWTGRKGYGARALVGACLVKSLYGLPTWTRTASLIEQHGGLQDALGGRARDVGAGDEVAARARAGGVGGGAGGVAARGDAP